MAITQKIRFTHPINSPPSSILKQHKNLFSRIITGFEMSCSVATIFHLLIALITINLSLFATELKDREESEMTECNFEHLKTIEK